MEKFMEKHPVISALIIAPFLYLFLVLAMSL